MCKWPILGTEDSRILFGGTWIPDSSHQWDSGFLELYSGFHKQKFPRFWKLDLTSININKLVIIWLYIPLLDQSWLDKTQLLIPNKKGR